MLPKGSITVSLWLFLFSCFLFWFHPICNPDPESQNLSDSSVELQTPRQPVVYLIWRFDHLPARPHALSISTVRNLGCYLCPVTWQNKNTQTYAAWVQTYEPFTAALVTVAAKCFVQSRILLITGCLWRKQPCRWRHSWGYILSDCLKGEPGQTSM